MNRDPEWFTEEADELLDKWLSEDTEMDYPDYLALLYLGWVSSAENLTYPLSYRLRTPPLREPQMDAVGNRPTARNSGTDL